MPPSASSQISDVLLDHWAADWIEQLAAEGIIRGCGEGNNCPADSVTGALCQPGYFMLVFGAPW